jgi:hypothetical protein
MKLPSEALDDFIELYKQECGEDLNRQDASEMTHRLLTLYEVLARKRPQKDAEPKRPVDDGDRNA